MKMNKESKEEMFKDPNGKISSTRKQSWAMQNFFYFFNVIYLGLIGLLIWLSLSMGDTAKIDFSIFLFLCLTWWFLDALLLLAIFTPKQLAKKIELSEIVALAGKIIDKKK